MKYPLPLNKDDGGRYKKIITEEDILSRLYGIGVGSTTRLGWMLEYLQDEPRELFWPVFQAVWSDCDDTAWAQDEIADLLEWHGPPLLTGDDLAFYAALGDIGDKVELFRGCTRSRLHGLSWTTDRAIAEGFARGHRGIRVPDAIVARAIVPKTDVLTVITDRSESEVLISSMIWDDDPHVSLQITEFATDPSSGS